MKLAKFEGLDVIRSSVEIPGAAGGLRDAMKVDPIEAHKGDTMYVVLECVVAKVRHDPIDKEDFTGPQERVHILSTTSATIVDKELVFDALAAQKDRIAEAKELEGQQKFATTPPFNGYDDKTADEVCESIEAYADDGDLDAIDRVETYEEANGGRGKVLEACAAARKVLAKA